MNVFMYGMDGCMGGWTTKDELA